MYNSDKLHRMKSNCANLKNYADLREHFIESKSVAEPIRKLKEQRASCSNCSQFKSHPPHHLMYVCKKISSDHEGSVKFVKPYNLCAQHTVKK